MKRAIEVADIRKGDTIRYEPTQPEVLVAAEYLAERDGQAYLPNSFGHHYLLDRPTRPVELPEVPTLGWIEHWDGRRVAGVFSHRLDAYEGDRPAVEGYDSDKRWERNTWYRVTAFVAATAVPTEALDKLRNWIGGWSGSAQHDTPAKLRISQFLEAVDAAAIPTHGDAS